MLCAFYPNKLFLKGNQTENTVCGLWSGIKGPSSTGLILSLNSLVLKHWSHHDPGKNQKTGQHTWSNLVAEN